MSEEDDLPGDAEANPLALRSSDTQLDVGRPGNRLVLRAAIDALASLQSLSDKRWQVGEFALREQDYRQLQIWLEHLNSNGRTWTLEEFVSSALGDFYEDGDSGKSVVDGTILRLNLTSMGFRELDLSKVPSLTFLSCTDNPLTELVLSNAPNLTVFVSESGQLSELDLSNAPSLIELDCAENELTKLDLPNAPNLTDLCCCLNQLKDLDLSKVSNLTELVCDSNELTKLELSSVPNLTYLRCSDNQLTALQLSKVPNLTSLHCCGNQLTELDIRNCPNLLNITCDPGVLVRKRSDQSVERIG